MKPILLCRWDSETSEEERKSAELIWGENCCQYRTEVPNNSLVIGRYSVLPFYVELEKELKLKNCELINNYSQHQFIADMEWYEHIKHITPKSFFDVGYANVPECENGYVIKGATNSRKAKWNTHMYAKDRSCLPKIMNNLLDDSLISYQKLVIREYIPLKTFDIGLHGLPITNEWRFFFLGCVCLTGGYYWTIYDKKEDFEIPYAALDKASEAAAILSEYVNFFVVDVAETEQGDWIVIEVNDGQMSGLSYTNPHDLYVRLLTEI